MYTISVSPPLVPSRFDEAFRRGGVFSHCGRSVQIASYAVFTVAPTLGGLAKDCILAGTRIGLSAPSEPAAKPTGSAVLSYLVTYRTLAANSTLVS